MSELIIRPYREDDRSEVRQIAWETAFLGESGASFFSDQEVLCDFLTIYFTDYEPESCFVAEYQEKIIGYLIGSLDEHRMNRIFISRIFLPIILKIIARGTLFKKKCLVFILRCMISFFIGEFEIPDFSDEYPAVLHINIRKKFRGAGIGSELMSAFFDYLRAHNVGGVHLSTMSKEAGMFFKRNGFEMLHAGTRTYLWHVQKQEVFVYWFGKKILSLPRDHIVSHRKSWFSKIMHRLGQMIKNLFDKRKKVSYI